MTNPTKPSDNINKPVSQNTGNSDSNNIAAAEEQGGRDINPTKQVQVAIPSENNPSLNKNNSSNNNIAAAEEQEGRDINPARPAQGGRSDTKCNVNVNVAAKGKGLWTTKKSREDDGDEGSRKKPRKRAEVVLNDVASKKPAVACACYKCGKTFGTKMAVSGHLRWCGYQRSHNFTPPPPLTPVSINKPIKPSPKLMNIEPEVLWEQIAPRLINVARNVLAREQQPASSAVEGSDSNYSSQTSAGNEELAQKGGVNIDLNLPPPAEEDDAEN